MDSRQEPELFAQLPTELDSSQPIQEPTTNPPGNQSHPGSCQEQQHPSLPVDDPKLRQVREKSSQLEFQDSHLSPALSLLRLHSGAQHNFTEYSLLQQSDLGFAPLRVSPDISVASEKFQNLTQDPSLSQHPIAQMTVLSKDGSSSSCCSLSQHSMSPGDESRQTDGVRSRLTPTAFDRPLSGGSREGTGNEPLHGQSVSNPPDRQVGEASEYDAASLLSGGVPARQLLRLLQKDVSMRDSSSSAESSALEASLRRAAPLVGETKSTDVSEINTESCAARRERLPGDILDSQQQTQALMGESHPRKSDVQSSQVANITIGFRSTLPDDSTEELHRQLLSEVERHSSCEVGSKSPVQATKQYRNLNLTKTPQWEPATTRGILTGVYDTGPRFLAGSAAEWGSSREGELWCAANHTGIDGSYLGFLPQSQSTPGVFNAPAQSGVMAPSEQLPTIVSKLPAESSSKASMMPAVATADIAGTDSDVCPPSSPAPGQQEMGSENVQALPSLNYMQKVDAWRANQSLSKTSLFDNLAPQGFSGVSPKKQALDAISDSLNRIISQQVQTKLQDQTSSATNQAVTRGPVVTHSSSSSLRRHLTVGSMPIDKDTGFPACPSDSPLGRSQSHSSLSTVVTSVQLAQLTEAPVEQDNSQPQGGAHQQPSTVAQPTLLMSPGRFSDVSLDIITSGTFSNSQDCCGSVQKPGASVGASSVVSLEVDNYAPYWSSKLSLPPPPAKPRELNIEERIPLYLHNLGIDQSPSTILTPFAPSGPIREPEFSPSDLCTIKGSEGTPTKSTQPSEDDSPQKGAFSRSSLLSMDSSMSIPLSIDSLYPPLSFSEHPRASPSQGPAVSRSSLEVAAISLPSDLSPHLLSFQPNQNPQREGCASSSRVAIQLSDRSESSSTEDSFVGTQTVQQIHQLLGKDEHSPAVSSSSPSTLAASHLHSDDNILVSLRMRTGGFQDSPYHLGGPGSPSPLLWARSSSDSMLTSGRQRQSSVGHESATLPGRLENPSTQGLTFPLTAATHTRPQDDWEWQGLASPLSMSKSARRAEPEGCSAAASNNTAPAQTVKTPAPVVSVPQPAPGPGDAGSMPEEEAGSPPLGSAGSIVFSPPPGEHEQGAMSDRSSGSSLTARVAKLLQSDSSGTVVSGTTSTVDKEENQAREWIKMKLSRQKCEPLQLDAEDRRRIEEIKRELLLKQSVLLTHNTQNKHTILSRASTDTESSAVSSLGVLGARPGHPHPHQQQQLAESSSALPEPGCQLPSGPAQDLEARVREIIVKEEAIPPRENTSALSSITISTRRRSTSRSPSPSSAPPLNSGPEPRRLTPLSTADLDGDNDPIEPASILECNSGLSTREGAVGGQQGQRPTTSKSQTDELGKRRDRQDSLPPPFSSVSAFTQIVDGVPYRFTADPPTSSGHISHIHLCLSPPKAAIVQRPPSREFVPLRRLSPAAISPDKGLDMSSPVEKHDTREPTRRQEVPHRVDTSMLFKTAIPECARSSAALLQLVTPQRLPVSPRPLTVHTPAIPVLLPYKPHGSKELFYVPQTELSSASQSDTTIESTHPGSDDAVPPCFSSEVLGKQDPGLDRGVTIKHTEGIYSKRMKTTSFRMQPELHPGTQSVDRSSPMGATRASSSQVSAFIRVPPSGSRRDQATSPVRFLTHNQLEDSGAEFRLMATETDCSTSGGNADAHTEPQAAQHPSQQSDSVLDQLWRRFIERRSLDESPSTNEREASLLERLERLARLMHATGGTAFSQEARRMVNVRLVVEEGEERRRIAGKEGEARQRANRKSTVGDVSAPCQVWMQAIPSSAFSNSSPSHISSSSEHLCPAERDESEAASTRSSLVSTVDTARLERAFGADRVRRLKTGPGLSQLYSSIDRQKEVRQVGRLGGMDTLPETTDTEDSTIVADSVSSSSTSTPQPRRGPSQSLAAKKAVRLVNKGIQAGDLEIVNNATCHHTRDVGTTFPSPREARSPSCSSSLEKGCFQGILKESRILAKCYPQGVSWFVPADDLQAEARKENRPGEMEGEETSRRPGSAWFEAYSKIPAWREPLRQRQVQGDRSGHAEHLPEPRSKMTSGGLVRLSLQEALELHRPKFISVSRERMERLALQAEQRRLHSAFSTEREQQFFKPEGTRRVVFRRAVPRKEMVQRSKQIYETLPEVQRKRVEQRRRAEYDSYRRNAQIYNQRITSRVLGKAVAWQ